MAYEFHYTPTGTGVISGKEVLEQTEDAINDLGNTAISGVQEALDKAEQALTNSANAVDDAQTALNTANNAEGVAVQAQNDVSNLSGSVTNLGNRVTTTEGNIGNLQGRMTTAEGNITNLQGRMTTAEGNIGNLQTAVSTAQATANSAQQTATTARLQSYVFRYSSATLVASSTNSNSLLDNTDNLKIGDKVIDSSGVLFSITAIDTANSTFTIGTSLIDLAQDSDVVHVSGNETVNGEKTFSNACFFNGQNTSFIRSNNDGVIVIGNGAFKKGQASNINLGREYHGTNTSISSCISFFGTSLSDNGNISQVVLSAINNTADSTQRTEFSIKYDKSDTRPRKFEFGGDVYPTTNGSYNCGLSDKKFLSFNGLNPGALSLPNLSGGVDISSYFSTGTVVNQYTAPADGWISIKGRSSITSGIVIIQDGMAQMGYSLIDFGSSDRVSFCALPVKAGVQVEIWLKSVTTLDSAKFFPCQGNV